MRLVAETGSTNQDLAREAFEGAAAGAVLIARHQTAGRGRQGRTWFDRPDSSLLMSWSVDIEPALAPLLPLVTGTAVCRAVEVVVGDNVAALKWPNDVLIPARDERKLVGILAEVATLDSSRAGSTLRVIVGMGTNIDLALEDAPDDVAARAIDLTSLTDAAVDRASLVDALLDACDQAVDELVDSPSKALEHYRERCLTIGRSIRFETPTGELEGVATGVADDGSLILRTADGSDHHLTAGDAHHVG